MKVRRHSRAIWKWGFSVLAAGTLLGGGLYFAEQKGLFYSEPSMAERSVILKGPANYVQTRARHLQEIGKAYQALLKINPRHDAAREGLRNIADRYEALARLTKGGVEPSLTLSLIDSGLTLVQDHKGLLALQMDAAEERANAGLTPLDKQNIQRWIEEGDAHSAASRFTLPVGANAVESYRKVLQLEPDNETALGRLNEMAAIFERVARTSMNKGDIEQGTVHIEQGLMINPNHVGLLALQKTLATRVD
jgi:tetratricopeptide (TPR) repeat protein